VECHEKTSPSAYFSVAWKSEFTARLIGRGTIGEAMSEPFLAEIRLFAFDFPPAGWATCDGQLLPITQNQSLYSLLGTTYGGNGRTSFALPDLRGRAPLHLDPPNPLGSRAGEETHSLGANEIPAHAHGAQATTALADSADGLGRLLGNVEGARFAITPYGSSGAPQALIASSVTGGPIGQGHENMQPFLTINFCIALSGIFP
jgi:microcystin-dependent protein